MFHLVIKKRKRALRPVPFFFVMILTFFKNILILIITSLAIHYSQNVSRGFSILECIGGTGVFWWLFFHFLLLLSHTRPALALTSRLPPFDRKTLKNCACSADPGFLNETKGSSFLLSCLSSNKTDGKNKLFLKPHQHSDKEVFLGVSRE